MKWFKIKAAMYIIITLFVMNSLFWFTTSVKFFDEDQRFFLLIVINQIYLVISLIISYLVYKYKTEEEDRKNLRFYLEAIQNENKRRN